MKKYLYSITIIASMMTYQANAQDDKERVGAERVTVTSEYQATLNDAFKINDNPLVDDADLNQKKEVNYTIFSVPVASTFAPAKGEAANVDSDSLANFYNNYALFSYGNYNTVRGELGIVEQIGSNNMYAGGLLKHLSSGGGIDGVLLDDNFSKSNLDFTVGQKKDNSHWNAQFGAMSSKFNWYGLPEDFNTLGIDSNSIDPLQKYGDVHLGASYENYNGAFEKLDVMYKYFWDDYSSKESRMILSPKFNIELADQTLHLNFEADYLNTEFSGHNIGNQQRKYSYLNLSVIPSIKFFDDDYSVELGAGLTYIMGKKNGIEDNSVVVFPQIKANYDLVKNIVQAYAGAVGGVKQNSYADLAEENPFVAPDLELLPTKTNYDIYAGLRGKLYHNISYNIRASYKSEDDKAMFTMNGFDNSLANRQGFQYGNSFSLMYDRINTLSVFGELNFDISDEVKMGFSGEYNNYTAEMYNNAYHLPEAKVQGNILINFTKQWFADINIAYIGQRFDYVAPQTTGGVTTYFSDKEIGDYTDLNMTVGYRPTSQWTFFLKGNNIFNQEYYRFNQYQVQGIQILGGAMYKFDF